jgi:transketolase C-terminal domain/subunit
MKIKKIVASNGLTAARNPQSQNVVDNTGLVRIAPEIPVVIGTNRKFKCNPQPAGEFGASFPRSMAA